MELNEFLRHSVIFAFTRFSRKHWKYFTLAPFAIITPVWVLLYLSKGLCLIYLNTKTKYKAIWWGHPVMRYSFWYSRIEQDREFKVMEQFPSCILSIWSRPGKQLKAQASSWNTFVHLFFSDVKMILVCSNFSICVNLSRWVKVFRVVCTYMYVVYILHIC